MDLTMMERVGDRWEKMEGYCSTGQSPQWVVVPVEEEEEEERSGEENLIAWNKISYHSWSIIFVLFKIAALTRHKLLNLLNSSAYV
jgi:hypothetical protein